MTCMLDGIRVVEMGHYVAIPACGALFADWGAEVIKVEPLIGERARGVKKTLGVSRTARIDGTEVDWSFELLNRGKKAIALDARQEQGQEILRKLVKKSDVFTSNYELSVLARFNLDYKTLSQLNPKLIYAVLTAYGSVGPDKNEPGFDYSAAWARSGTQHLIGEPGTPPTQQRPGMMDILTGSHAATGILGALLCRERTGIGQELEVSLYHSAVWTLGFDIQAALFGLFLPKQEHNKALNPLWNSYRTKDDRWLQFVMFNSDTYWPSFCKVIKRPELEKDARFSTMDAREQHCQELISLLDEIIASRPIAEWGKDLRKYNCIYARVQTPEEVTRDPQAIENNFFAEVQHPEGFTVKILTSPIKLSKTPSRISSVSPEVGQNTEEILLDLGYTWDDIATFKSQSIIL